MHAQFCCQCVHCIYCVCVALCMQTCSICVEMYLLRPVNCCVLLHCWQMNQGETSPPSLLTESDLIALMEKHGIGELATFLVNYTHSCLDLSLYHNGLLTLIYQFGMSYLH